jgi:hypothetical protein
MKSSEHSIWIHIAVVITIGFAVLFIVINSIQIIQSAENNRANLISARYECQKAVDKFVNVCFADKECLNTFGTSYLIRMTTMC